MQEKFGGKAVLGIRFSFLVCQGSKRSLFDQVRKSPDLEESRGESRREEVSRSYTDSSQMSLSELGSEV